MAPGRPQPKHLSLFPRDLAFSTSQTSASPGFSYTSELHRAQDAWAHALPDRGIRRPAEIVFIASSGGIITSGLGLGLGSVVTLPLWFVSDLVALLSREAVVTPGTSVSGDNSSSLSPGGADAAEFSTDS